MSWFVLSFVYVLLASIGNIFRKILLKGDKSDAVGLAIVFQLMGTVIVSVFALFYGFHLPPITQYPLNYIIQASLWGMATLVLFKAYQYIEASEVTILVTLEAVVTIIFARIFLHDTFTILNFIGTACIISAVIYLSQTSSKITFNKGVLYAIAYSFLAGLAIVNDTFLLKHSEVLSFQVIGFLTPGIFLLIIRPKAITHMKKVLTPIMPRNNFMVTFPVTLAALAFYSAIAKGGEASQVNTIAQATVVFTVILAAIFLKERDHLLKKCVCAILVTIGVLLLR